jgi:hypothetical protein
MTNEPGEPSIPVDDLWENADEIPEDMRKEVRALFHSASFRQLRSRDEQMLYIRTQERKFPYAIIAILFKLSTSAVFRAIRKREKVNEDLQSSEAHPPQKPGPNMALTPTEEQTLIAWIEARQRNGDCPSPREVRDQASHFFKIRNKEERPLGRHWWRCFKLRHGGRIGLVPCTSQEPARNAVNSSAVNDYFAKVLDAISHCVSPFQILNMDESGVSARPFKGKQKKVVFVTDCPVAPRFQDIRDVSHVSIVGTISLGLKSLPPLLLTTSEVAFKNRELLLLHDDFFVFRTARGYMTIDGMLFYINSIMAPYVQSLRDRFLNQQLKVYLIADNHGTHTNPEVLALCERIGIVPIWLPPHSSHFLQPLDLTVFASFKRHYANLRRPQVKPQLEGKILRLLHAWHQATYVGCIDGGWRLGAIDVKPPSRGQGIGVVNIRTMNEIMMHNCPDAEDWFRTERSSQ